MASLLNLEVYKKWVNISDEELMQASCERCCWFAERGRS